MPKTLRLRELGELHDLLLEACPPMKKGEKGALYPHPEGVKSIAILAELLGMSAWGVHLWVKKGRIPYANAERVALLSEGRVSLEKFSPFIYDMVIVTETIPA